MFCPQAISLSQKGFPTLLCSNLTLQSAPISMALPDQGEQSRIVSVAAGRAESLAAVMRETSALGLSQGMVQGLMAEKCWPSETGAGVQCPFETSPLSLPFLLLSLQLTTVFYLFLSCTVCFSFSFFSLNSFLCLFSLLILVQCVFPLWFSSKIAAPTLHDQYSVILTLLEHWTMLGAQPLQQTWWMNSTPCISLAAVLQKRLFCAWRSKACQPCLTWRKAAAKPNHTSTSF